MTGIFGNSSLKRQVFNIYRTLFFSEFLAFWTSSIDRRSPKTQIILTATHHCQNSFGIYLIFLPFDSHSVHPANLISLLHKYMRKGSINWVLMGYLL